MINYTLQHVLVMRLLMQYPLKTSTAVHNLLYLVSADDTKRHELGFYDFIRLNHGPYSPNIQTIIDELMVNQLLIRTDFELTPKGREIYYGLGSALRGFEDFVNKCTQIVTRNKNDLNLLNKSVKSNFILRRTPVGKKVFA